MFRHHSIRWLSFARTPFFLTMPISIADEVGAIVNVCTRGWFVAWIKQFRCKSWVSPEENIRCHHHKLWKMAACIRVSRWIAIFPRRIALHFPLTTFFSRIHFEGAGKLTLQFTAFSKRAGWNSVDFHCDCKWVGFVAVDVQTLFADRLSVLDEFLKTRCYFWRLIILSLWSTWR